MVIHTPNLVYAVKINEPLGFTRNPTISHKYRINSSITTSASVEFEVFKTRREKIVSIVFISATAWQIQQVAHSANEEDETMLESLHVSRCLGSSVLIALICKFRSLSRSYTSDLLIVESTGRCCHEISWALFITFLDDS